MARTFRDRAAQQLRQKQEQLQNQTASAVDHAVDAVVNLPNNLKEFPEHARQAANGTVDAVKQKADLLLTTVEAKQMLKDRLFDTEDYKESEFVYKLATDETLRKTVSRLVEPVLNPTPVSADPVFKENSYINIGAGLSTFWTEIQKKTPIEMEEMTQLDNILMGIEAGLDKDLEPETRKSMLSMAGLTADQIEELVPLSDYVEYEDRLKEFVRAEVIADYGLNPNDLSEQDELLLDSVTEDRIMATKLQVDPEDPALSQGPAYEDLYGYSAQELHEMFSDEPVPEGMPADVPVDDGYWSQYMDGPMEALQEIYDAAPEANWAAYQQMMEAEQEVQNVPDTPILTDADLAFAEEMEQGQGISEEDLAFAKAWAQEEGFGEPH